MARFRRWFVLVSVAEIGRGRVVGQESETRGLPGHFSLPQAVEKAENCWNGTTQPYRLLYIVIQQPNEPSVANIFNKE